MKQKDVEELLVTCVTDHKEDFYRLAFSYVKNQQDALDILQESIQKALIAIESIQNPDAIKSWFYKIVVRTSLDFLKKRQKMTFVDEPTLEFLSPGKEESYHVTQKSPKELGTTSFIARKILSRVWTDLFN